MELKRQLLIAALIPAFAFSACSDNSNSDSNSPDTVETPIDSNPPGPPTAEQPSVPNTDSDPDAPDMASPDPSDGTEDDGTVNGSNPLANTQWRMCQGNGPSTLFQFSFTETEYSYTHTFFEAGACEGPSDPTTEINGGTYTLGDTLTTTDGLQAIELDMLNTRVLGGELPQAYQQFSIVHIDGDIMYMANLPEYDEADRPQSLDFEDEYRRHR